ncbi:TPA: hypothetical protein P7S17_005145 [Escherichia coli]|nr:hypothetical protein [Escherichia coli]
MNKALGFVLGVFQHLCSVVGLVLLVYLLSASTDDPTINPWLLPIVILGLGALLKLARKGIAADEAKKVAAPSKEAG